MKKKFVALNEQEMRQISGGCWLCKVWNWLKSHVTGTTIEYREGDRIYTAPGAQFTVDI